MVKAGDTNGRRGNYLRRLCAKLHGLKENALVNAQFTGNWKPGPLSPSEIELPQFADQPVFSGKYWRLYWMKYPELMPEIGKDVEECIRNFKEYVGTLSLKPKGLQRND